MRWFLLLALLAGCSPRLGSFEAERCTLGGTGCRVVHPVKWLVPPVEKQFKIEPLILTHQ